MASIQGAAHTFRHRGVVALWGAVWQVFRANLAKRFWRRRFLERRVNNYRLLLDLQDKGISRTLLLFGTREREHKYILEKAIRPGMRVFDIGANIGYYAIMELGLLGSSGELVAIEPSLSNVALLKKNLALNGYGNVPIIEAAVSDQKGERLFHLSRESNLNTFHNVGSGLSHLSGEQVKVVTLSVPDVAATFGVPDLIRMDVEGHEVEVINGMLSSIQRGIMAPTIVFETHLSRYSEQHDMARVMTELFDCGYSTRYLASSYERGTRLIEARGYSGSDPISTDGVKRVIFENIKSKDAIDFVCKVGGARTVLLSPERNV